MARQSCPRCHGTMTVDPSDSDGTTMCFSCGYRAYGLAPLPLVHDYPLGVTYQAGKNAEDRAAVLRMARQGLAVQEIAHDLELRVRAVEGYLHEARQEGLLGPPERLDMAAIAHYADLHGRQAAAQQFGASLSTVHRARRLHP